MWGEKDSQWQNVVDPSTGKGFSAYGDYANWAKNMETQGKAASSGFNTAGGSVGMGEGANNPYANYDWGKTSVYGDDWGGSVMPQGVDATGKVQFQSRTPAANGMFNYSGGYIDPKTGQITFTAHDKGGGFSTSGGGFGPTGQAPGGFATEQGQANYDPYQDYGLGSGAEGIIPIAHDNNGTPTMFYAATQGGGGQVFPSVEDAQAAVQGYRQWKLDQQRTARTTNGVPAAGTTTGGAGNTSTTTGALMTPGSGEKFYDSTKDFYTQPTEGHKVWEQTANQPTKMEQNWNAFNGQYNQPSNAEQQWATQKDFYGDPGQLDAFYKRQEEKARGALSARASAAGIGDSSTAARATANLGLDFSDRLLAARQDFDKTGMGLAQGADTGFYQRATGARDLAGATDKSVLDKINEGLAVDSGDLARITSGQVSARSAQESKEKRLTGGLDTSTSLAKDIADMTAGGLSQADAIKMAPILSALEVQYRQGKLKGDAAYEAAGEAAAQLGISSNIILQYMFASKFGGPAPASSTSSNISIPGNVSMPVTT